MTRQEKDHERYLREREARKKKQREYYASHREEVLRKKRESGILTFGTRMATRRPSRQNREAH